MVLSDFKEPVLQLKGQQCLYIENYRKLLVYTPDKISIAAKSGVIEIIGSDLNIRYYSKEDLEIRGLINSLSFVKQR